MSQSTGIEGKMLEGGFEGFQGAHYVTASYHAPETAMPNEAGTRRRPHIMDDRGLSNGNYVYAMILLQCSR
jgi:hypothetical protein